MSSKLTHDYLDIKLTTKGKATYPTLVSALAICKAAGCKLTLSYKGEYSIDIYPESNITDLQTIEDLTFRNWNYQQENEALKRAIESAKQNIIPDSED